MKRLVATSVFCLIGAFCQWQVVSAQNHVEVNLVSGANAYRTFAPGQSFQLAIHPTVISGATPTDLQYQWVDYQGNALTNPVSLTPNANNDVSSPFVSMKQGYYGLKFLSNQVDLFNPNTNNHDELGFAVLPVQTNRTVHPSSRFGLVQQDYADPYLDPGTIKTRTNVHARNLTTNVVDAASWQNQIGARYNQGQLEIPVVIAEPWPTDDTQPVGQAQLDKLQSMFQQYFAADSRVPAWELGIEEQLSHNVSDHPFYFDNLQAKFQAAKSARDLVFPGGDGPKLVYQVVNANSNWLDSLFSHPVIDSIDVLANHPYDWSGFHDIDTDPWHLNQLANIRSVMKQYGKFPELWYTEGGAPINDAEIDVAPAVPGNQMYAGDGSTLVNASTRTVHPRFMVKMHMEAFDKGVQQFTWYNYKDLNTPSTTDVERHFGLRDSWDFPKPSYAAYGNMVNLLRDKTLESTAITADGVRMYRYTDGQETVTVAWAPVGTTQTLAHSALLGIAGANPSAVSNVVGSPLAFSGNSLDVGEDPIYMVGPVGTPSPVGMQLNIDLAAGQNALATGDDGVVSLQGNGSHQWNALALAGGNNLKDIAGNATTVNFHFDTPANQLSGGRKTNAGFDDAAREEVHNVVDNGAKAIDFTLGGLATDGTSYDLYLLVTNIWNGIDQGATVFGATETTTGGAAYAGGDLVEGVDYVVFEGLIPGANGEIKGRVHHAHYLQWDSNAYFNGLQLVSHPLATLTAQSADFDNDGDGADFLVWQRQGISGGLDLADWEAAFGMSAAAAVSLGVPEPATGFLLVLGGMVAFGRKQLHTTRVTYSGD